MDQDAVKTSEKPKNPKIAFVLSLPLDMSAPEVSTRAKQAGLTINPGYVHTIRSAAKKAKAQSEGTGKVAKPAKGAKKASPRKLPKAGKTVNTGPAAKAKPAARTPAADKPTSPKKAKPAKKAAPKKATAKKAPVAKTSPKVAAIKPVAAKPAAAASSPDVVFRKLVLELGLLRSRQLLDEVETKLAKLIAGT